MQRLLVRRQGQGRTSSRTVSVRSTHSSSLRTFQVWAPMGSGPFFAAMYASQVVGSGVNSPLRTHMSFGV